MAELHADGPRPENDETTSALVTLPTATAPGAEAGLAPVLAPGPELPAAKTGTMPAARSAARSPLNSVSQCPGPPSSQEPLSTLGASLVCGLPSGSRAHSKTRWTALVVLRPPSLKTRAARMRTSGAIETTTSATSVPCPDSSYGAVCWSYGSNQLPGAVESCGKPVTRPVSITATRAPRPVWPCAHICGAPVAATLVPGMTALGVSCVRS